MVSVPTSKLMLYCSTFGVGRAESKSLRECSNHITFHYIIWLNIWANFSENVYKFWGRDGAFYVVSHICDSTGKDIHYGTGRPPFVQMTTFRLFAQNHKINQFSIVVHWWYIIQCNLNQNTIFLFENTICVNGGPLPRSQCVKLPPTTRLRQL